jgi:phytoene/squalene synthetase
MESTLQAEKTILGEIFNSIDFEKITDHPNILIAAHFWDEERYEAAKVCYKFMRAIDDLVDNYKTEHTTLSRTEQDALEADVCTWIKTILNPEENNTATYGLTNTIRKFHIPAWPLEDFSRSMIYDIYNDGFLTLQAFLDYAKGASVAPASIFVHLCGLKRDNDQYFEPAFDVRRISTPCAIFSYLVHIIRNFVKDHTHNLNYFPDDLMQKYNLNRENLLAMANGAAITTGFRQMIGELYATADEYRQKTFEIMQEVKPQLEYRSQLSLEIIFALYLMVFERIDIHKGTFSTAELNPTSQEIKERVREVIEAFEIKNN